MPLWRNNSQYQYEFPLIEKTIEIFIRVHLCSSVVKKILYESTPLATTIRCISAVPS